MIDPVEARIILGIGKLYISYASLDALYQSHSARPIFLVDYLKEMRVVGRIRKRGRK